MLKSSRQHLTESKTTYFEHFKFAIYASLQLLYASFASLVHAFIPSLFKGSAALVVIKLYTQRLLNHPNTVYQTWIKEENDRNQS